MVGYYLQKYEPADLCFNNFLHIFDTKSWNIFYSFDIHIIWTTEFNTDIVDSSEMAASPSLPSCTFIVYILGIQNISFGG